MGQKKKQTKVQQVKSASRGTAKTVKSAAASAAHKPTKSVKPASQPVKATKKTKTAAASKSAAPKVAAAPKAAVKSSSAKIAKPAIAVEKPVAAKKPAAPAKVAAQKVHAPQAAERAPAPAKSVAKPMAASNAAVAARMKSEIKVDAKPAAKAAAPEVKSAAAKVHGKVEHGQMTAKTHAVAAASTQPAVKKSATPAAKPSAPSAAAPAQAKAVDKKPVGQRHGFKMNEYIVYPAHGVGRIVGIEEQEIAGMSLELFVITFDKEKLTLRVPTGKLESVGMRKLADEAVVRKAMETLKGRARIKRTMWSRRAQEYVAKINSGDLVAIAEVVRDLYRSEAQPEQSYSERQLYEDALDRMAREIAAVEKLDERGAVQRITEVLARSARSRRPADAEEAEAA